MRRRAKRGRITYEPRRWTGWHSICRWRCGRMACWPSWGRRPWLWIINGSPLDDPVLLQLMDVLSCIAQLS